VGVLGTPFVGVLGTPMTGAPVARIAAGTRPISGSPSSVFVVPPLSVKDPSVLFTGTGMNQFKPHGRRPLDLHVRPMIKERLKMKVKLVRLRIRGGAWYGDAWLARCAYRGRFDPGFRFSLLGFRCCFSPFFVIKRKARK